MNPDGITDCRICGQPTRGYGGGICDDCVAATEDPGDGMLGADWSFANPELAAALDAKHADNPAPSRLSYGGWPLDEDGWER